MKATGEVMAIAPNLEAGFMKAIRSLEENVEYLSLDKLKDLDQSNGGSIYIPTELKNDKDNSWYGINGELSDTFASIDYLLGITGSENPTYIDSLNENLESLSFSKIADNKDEILKSKIKVATGAFRTYMEIEMLADGPGTYIYEEV